jgi:hypothetical protein
MMRITRTTTNLGMNCDKYLEFLHLLTRWLAGKGQRGAGVAGQEWGGVICVDVTHQMRIMPPSLRSSKSKFLVPRISDEILEI